MDEIRDLIMRGKLSQALDKIIQWGAQNDSDIQNQAILLLSRLKNLEREERMGTISFSNASIQRNQITHSILSILGDMVELPASSVPIPPSPSPKNGSGKKMFISYAREDKDFVENLETHLHPLKTMGLVDTWIDSNLKPGEESNRLIEENLRSSDIILYMVSPNFLSSEYISNNERPWAEETRQRTGAIIVPVITRPCFWEGQDFAKFNAIPRHPDTNQLTPIAKWEDKDMANLTVVKGLESIIRERQK